MSPCPSMLQPWTFVSFLPHIWKIKLIALYAFFTYSGRNGHRFWSLAKFVFKISINKGNLRFPFL